MKTLYYDCFAGISGDMNLAAMIDLGVDPDMLVSELKKLNLNGWELKVSKGQKGGISGTRVDIICAGAPDSCDVSARQCAAEPEPHLHSREHGSAHSHEHSHEHGEPHSHGHGESHTHKGDSVPHEHRSFKDIKEIISNSGLAQSVKDGALKIFSILAEAEAAVHGKTPDEVHFHEVGALDSIIDIVGAAVCFELLSVDKFSSSAVELGGGTVRCAHGVLPVPAPATALIAKKFPFKINGAPHECTTPTGAAILAAVATDFCAPTGGKLLSVGVGLGHRDCPTLPNLVRAMLFEDAEAQLVKSMFEIAANIDDMTPESVSVLSERLFAAGARDVWTESIFMKKNRPAFKVSALADADVRAKVRAAFFENSSTLGLRETAVSRCELARESENFESSLGAVRFKKTACGGETRAKPEFDDVKKIADSLCLPFNKVYEIIKNEYENR